MINFDLLQKDLIRDEGYKRYPYKCTGRDLHRPDKHEAWTVGVGHKMSPNEIADGLDKPWSKDRIFETLQQDMHLALRGCEQIFGRTRFLSFSEPRQRALANMCFQLGAGGLSGFRRMIAAIYADDWNRAYDEALDSLWAKQTPGRALRVAWMILEG